MSSGARGKGKDPSARTTDAALRQLRERCRTGSPPSLIVVHGEDEYRRSEVARRLPSWIVPDEQQRDMLVTVFAGKDAGAKSVLDALATEALPFFAADRRVVLFRDCPLLASKSDAPSVALAERISKGLPDDLTLIIEATAADKRTKLCAACFAQGTVLEFPKAERESEAAEFLSERLRLAGIRADADALTEMLAMLPSESGVLASEARKLASWLGDRKHATIADVRAVVSRSREAAVFDLTDRLGARDVAGALRSLRELLHQGQSGLGIVMLVASRLRLLLVARSLIDEGAIPRSLLGRERYDYRFRSEWEDVASRLKPRMPDDRAANLALQHPFVVWKTLGEAERFGTEELRRAIARAAEADVALKSTTGLSESDLVTHFVLSLCQPESLLSPADLR